MTLLTQYYLMKNVELKDVFTPSQPAAEINYIQRPSIAKRFDIPIKRLF